jgi:hypothetical protein
MPTLPSAESDLATQRIHQLLGYFQNGPEDPTYVVLKSHLLAEEILREYIASLVKHPRRIEEARLSFSQLLSMCRALHPILPDDWWGWIGLSKLNSLNRPGFDGGSNS